jgi:hypothetical protein
MMILAATPVSFERLATLAVLLGVGWILTELRSQRAATRPARPPATIPTGLFWPLIIAALVGIVFLSYNLLTTQR